jgi:hypothetical protein
MDVFKVSSFCRMTDRQRYLSSPEALLGELEKALRLHLSTFGRQQKRCAQSTPWLGSRCRSPTTNPVPFLPELSMWRSIPLQEIPFPQRLRTNVVQIQFLQYLPEIQFLA